jgi:hypothetical protein
MHNAFTPRQRVCLGKDSTGTRIWYTQSARQVGGIPAYYAFITKKSLTVATFREVKCARYTALGACVHSKNGAVDYREGAFCGVKRAISIANLDIQKSKNPDICVPEMVKI